MAFPEKYDVFDKYDILRYAKWLIGKTFYEILEEDLLVNKRTAVSGYAPLELNPSILKTSIEQYGNAQRKGGLGNLIEERYFHYSANSNSEADFSQAGLEVKVTPYEERHGKGKHAGDTYYVAGERLVLCMINYNDRPIEFNLFKSHLWEKCGHILLIFYLRNKLLCDNLKYRIDFVDIFTPSDADKIIMRQDYATIMHKIAKGLAHEISESDTMYLGACTKGSTAAKSKITQDVNNIPAQRRAFCFKTSYMTTVLNEYFIRGQKERESIVTDKSKLSELGFEGYLQSRINDYIGKTDREICRLLNIKFTGNKAQWINIAFAILGVKSNKAIEFQKANIVVKATRLEEDGSIKENTSFPPFKFIDLAKEVWLDSDEEYCEKPSTIQSYFSSTKFLFVVFRKTGNAYVLKGCQLWNMPYHDLNVIVKEGWQKIQRTIIDGVHFTPKPVRSGKRAGKIIMHNNFPRKDVNPIIHIRPHAKKAYYKFEGYEDGNPADGNQLPNGDWMTTQCFWLNNSYVSSILKDDLKR